MNKNKSPIKNSWKAEINYILQGKISYHIVTSLMFHPFPYNITLHHLWAEIDNQLTNVVLYNVYKLYSSTDITPLLCYMWETHTHTSLRNIKSMADHSWQSADQPQKANRSRQGTATVCYNGPPVTCFMNPMADQSNSRNKKLYIDKPALRLPIMSIHYSCKCQLKVIKTQRK